MLYLIGIGLGNEKDLTINSLDALKNCDIIYLESYTSNIGFDIKKLEYIISKPVVIAERKFVESETIAEEAVNNNVALLIKGDVFSATTHAELFLNSKKKNVECKILHNSSILTAVGDTGLSLYKFGRVLSIPYDNEDIDSIYDSFLENKNLHTLFLLDLKPSDGKFMNFRDGFNYLINKSMDRNDDKINSDTYCVVCSGLGTENQLIKYGKISDLFKLELDVYPQCIIVPGKLHFIEEDVLNLYIITT